MITETLFFPYRKERLLWPNENQRVLFLNAEYGQWPKGVSLTVHQPKYNLALPFIQRGIDVLADVGPEHTNTFDTVWLLPGKDLQETQYLLASAYHAAKEGAMIVAAAANLAGGQRLGELFSELGLDPSDESKNKARVVYAAKQGTSAVAAQWLTAGKEQTVIDGKLISRPGLHAWNKIDDGSAMLAKHLPTDLAGKIADFGCGWGFLSLQAASTSPNVQKISLVDIDARAVSIAEKNLRAQHPQLSGETIWADLTRPDLLLGPFDAILLNPPFHDGIKSDPALGLAIIAAAARSLTVSGRLYLVANKHLPYEKTLKDLFPRVTVLAEEAGFKAFLCRP